MTDEPASLSDWIHFLISQKNHAYALIIGLISFILTITLLGLWYWERLLLLGFYTLVILSFAIASVLLIIVYHPNSILNRPKILLNEIMDEKKIDVKKIKKEWFEWRRKGKEMFEDISIFAWKRLRDFTITLGIGILGISLILMIWGTEFFSMIGIQWIASLGVAILAIGVAFHSIVISKKSSEEITAIANATYLELVDIFEDKRIQLLQHSDWLGIEGTVWKCWTYVKRAIKLMEYAEIDDENQTELAKQYIKLTFHTGIDWENKIVKKADIENMIKICSSLLEFNLKSKDKDELKGIYSHFEKIKKKMTP